jgi:hypothetical protein
MDMNTSEKSIRPPSWRAPRRMWGALLLMGACVSANAEDVEVCVATVDDLIAAIHATEGHDGVYSIQVAQGTYDFSGRPVFADASASPTQIFLRGGYPPNCDSQAGAATFDPRETRFVNVPFFGVLAGTDMQAWGFTLELAPQSGMGSKTSTASGLLDMARVVLAAPNGQLDLHHVVLRGPQNPTQATVRVRGQSAQVYDVVVQGSGNQYCALKAAASTSLVINHVTVVADAGSGLCLDADSSATARISNSVFVTQTGDNDVVVQTPFAATFSHIAAGAMPAGGSIAYAEYTLGSTELFESYVDGNLRPSPILDQAAYWGSRWPNGMNLEEPGSEHDVYYKERFDCGHIQRGAIQAGADVNELVFENCFDR